MKFRRIILALLIALMVAPAGVASTSRDDEEKYDVSIRKGIRRLFPNREREKAIKRLQQQRGQKTAINADPWDTNDEVWGTVDLPPETSIDSTAAVGHRLQPQTTSKTKADKEELERLLNTDYSIKEYGMGIRRMTWHDEPVTSTVEQLMPSMAFDGEQYFSKYVSTDGHNNEVYFAFSMQDSVPGPLRLCVQYCADDPLKYDQLTFSVDGFDYIFYPDQPQRGKFADGLYWENSDDELKTGYKDLVYALAHSHWVIFKLQGANGISHVKMLTDGQRQDFANTLALYRLLGGML